MSNLINWYAAVLKNYAGFKGRAGRKEYWWFFLTNIIILAVITVLEMIVSKQLGGKRINIVSALYGLAVFIPILAVNVRRLHDTGRSGWYLFWFYFLSTLYGALIVYSIFAMAKNDAANLDFLDTIMLLLAIFGLLVSVFSIYFIYLVSKKGDAGPNKYGPVPENIIKTRANEVSGGDPR